MNQVFDLNRWVLLMGKHWSENRKRYLLSLAAIVALFIIWYAFIMLTNNYRPISEEVQYASYFVGLFLVGCLYGSMLFADVSGGPKAIHYMRVPASLLEKLLSNLVYGIVLFFVCYTVIFYLVDLLMVYIGNKISMSHFRTMAGYNMPGMRITYPPSTTTDVVNVFYRPDSNGLNPSPYFFLAFLAIQSAYILGSIYFSKFSFIKTTVSLLLVVLAVALYIGYVLVPLMPRLNFGNYFTEQLIWMPNGEAVRHVVKLPDWIGKLLTFLFKYAFAPLFWVVTLFRLKEKEV